MSKRNVDKCRQEDGQIRRDEVDDEHLLNKCNVMVFFCFVVFKLGKSFGHSSKDSTCNGENGRKQNSRNENLTC